MKFIFALLIFTLVFSWAFAQELSVEDIDTAVTRLGAESFMEREQASAFLWRHGSVARDALTKGLKSKDPEIRIRSKKILNKINSGIFPSTPKKLVVKLQRYKSLDYENKCSVIDLLANAGDVGLESLRFLIESQIADENANLKPFKELRKKKGFLSRLLKTPKQHASFIESLLLVNALDSSNYKDYLAWTVCNNGLKLRIPEFEKRVNGPRGRQYLKVLAMLYRADGRLTEAKQAAERSEFKWFAIRVALENGDFKSCLRIYKSLNKDQHNVETLGWIATLQRLTENQKKFEQTIQDAIQLTVNDNDKFWFVAKILMINELFAETIDLSMKRKTERHFLAFKERPGEYFKAFDKYLREGGEPPLEGIIFLFKHRQLDKAHALFKEIVAKALKSDSPKQLPAIISLANSIKHKAFDALLKKALNTKELKPVALAKSMYGKSGYLWWTYFSLKYPKEGNEQCFQRLRNFMHKKLKKEELLSFLNNANLLLAILPKEEQIPLRSILGHLYSQNGHDKKALAEKIQIFKLQKNEMNMLAIGDWYANNSEWEKSAEWYEKTSSEYPEKSVPLYLWGHALCKIERQKEGMEKMRIASLLPLGKPAERYKLANALESHQLYSAAFQEFNLIRLIEYHYNSWYLLESYKCLLNIDQMKDRNWLQTGHYIRVAMFACLSTNMSFLSHEPYLLFAYLRHWLCAKGFMHAKNFKEALKELQAAVECSHEKVDESIRAIENFEKNGRQEEADLLYQTQKSILEADLKVLPQSTQLGNSIAWFMACNGRDLEAALALAIKSVKIELKNVAFLDTLAEVYFRLKNRDKAVEWQKKAVKYSSSTELKFMETRLKHFQNDPFPE